MKLNLIATYKAVSLPPFLKIDPQDKAWAHLEKDDRKTFYVWMQDRWSEKVLKYFGITDVTLPDGEVLWSSDPRTPEVRPTGFDDYQYPDVSSYEERNQPLGLHQKLYKLDPRNNQPAEQSKLEHYQTNPYASEWKLKSGNPFSESKIQALMFRFDVEGLFRFQRLASGVWFTMAPRGAAGAKNADQVYPCWLDVRNPYIPTEKEARMLWGVHYTRLQPFLDNLKRKGHDAYIQGQEGGDITVFETVRIQNALTGRPM